MKKWRLFSAIAVGFLLAAIAWAELDPEAQIWIQAIKNGTVGSYRGIDGQLTTPRISGTLYVDTISTLAGTGAVSVLGLGGSSPAPMEWGDLAGLDDIPAALVTNLSSVTWDRGRVTNLTSQTWDRSKVTNLTSQTWDKGTITNLTDQVWPAGSVSAPGLKIGSNTQGLYEVDSTKLGVTVNAEASGYFTTAGFHPYTLQEYATDAGVNADGVILKDGEVRASKFWFTTNVYLMFADTNVYSVSLSPSFTNLLPGVGQ